MMCSKIKSVQVALLLVLLQLGVSAQKAGSLPRSTPEAEGVSAKAISAFLDSIANSKHELHSFMLVRHGKVIAEGWWNPYRPDLKHTMYSLSKSFTATAVGFAKAEGKLLLSDKAISFFPGQLPDTISENLAQLTVKDLLTMSVGQDPDPTRLAVQDTNWVKRFFSVPIKHKPGLIFLYNSMATYMLSAIVQKTTGQKVIDYLQPRLFEPLGIRDIDWETDGKGINTGGWGLRLKTEDIAKFAQLFLQKGVWQGRQLLPAGWAEEASTAHIIQHPDYPQEKRDSSDWEQGYGYQMWRSRNKAYRGDGAFGQYALVMPEQDAVIAITSETPDMQGELNLIWKVLLPAMQRGKLPADGKADKELGQKLASLKLAPAPMKHVADSGGAIAGKQYTMEPNEMGIRTIAFSMEADKCRVQIGADTATYSFHFGSGNWAYGTTTLRGPYLVSGAQNYLTGLQPFQVAGRYGWQDANTLHLSLRYIESPHTQHMICHFDGDRIRVEVKRSFAYNAPGSATILNGALAR
jgi:CubicO group peptidase (beta-lactamase class C family)